MAELRDRLATALGGELGVNLLGNGYDVEDLLVLADAVIRQFHVCDRVAPLDADWTDDE